MFVLVGSHPNKLFRQWGETYGQAGSLFSPPKSPGLCPMYYVLDNGKYACFSSGKMWNADKFKKHVEKACKSPIQPQWIVVPDEVGNKQTTLELWNEWSEWLQSFNIPLAIAAQNGMLASDIPANADIIFVGGTTQWKWQTARYWTANFERVHIARVNSWNKLWFCSEIGAESVDGNGWFRGPDQRRDLQLFLALQNSSSILKKEWSAFPWVSPKIRKRLLKELSGINAWNLSDEPLFKN